MCLQMPMKNRYHLGTGVWVVTCHQTWVLGSKLNSFAQAAFDLTVSSFFHPLSIIFFNYLKTCQGLEITQQQTISWSLELLSRITF